MPNPQIRPTRTVNGETREWDGSQWVPSGGTAAPALPMANVPRGTFTPEQVKSNVDQGNWLLKNLLMTGGMIAGGAATGGVAPMIAGAALGRMAGHVPEAEVARFRGDDPRTYSVGSYLDEGAQGAMEGAAGEAQSRAVGPILKYGGKLGQFVGRTLGDVPGMEPRWRAGMGMSRAGLTHLIGGGPGLASVAAVGPMVASELGKRAERAGTAMMTRPGLAEGLGGAWEALKERLRPAASHADRLAAGAEEALARKTAPWRVPEPYPKAGPTGGDPHVNPFGVTMEGPPSASVPFQSPPSVLGVMDPGDANWQDWVRGGRARGPEAGPRVNTGSLPAEGLPHEVSAVNPRGRPLDAPGPDVAVTPRAFTGKSEDVIPPVTAGRSGFAFEPLPPDVAPTVTAGREGFAGDPAPREGVTVNPHGAVMSTTEQPSWLDQYAIDYPAPPPSGLGRTAGSVGPLQRRVMTPQQLDTAFARMQAQNAAQRAAAMGENFVSDVTASTPAPPAILSGKAAKLAPSLPTQEAGLASLDTLQRAIHGEEVPTVGNGLFPSTPATPAAPDLPANLTPDQLVEHYQTNYPAREPWIATGGGTRSGLVPHRPLKGVVADPAIQPPLSKEDFLDALRQSLLLGKR